MWQNNVKKPRQEICASLKWFCFILNFCTFFIGVTCLTLGIYLCVKEPRAITNWVDIIFNAAILITLIGLSICFMSLCGLFGALRDNVFLLKLFAFCVFSSYILLVTITFILFMFFYSENTDGISAHSVFIYSIKKYSENRNIADFIDYIQEQLECCGVNLSGYHDWQYSETYACKKSNPNPESCGVPFSCCRKSVLSETTSSGSPNSLQPAMRSLQCWQNAQIKEQTTLDNDIYVNGCLQPLRSLFEKNAIRLGVIVAVIILPVCFIICLSQCLARQINYQKYLLKREEKRNERLKRRERRYLEQTKKTSTINMPRLNNDNNINNSIETPKYLIVNENLMENGQIIHKKLSPPNFPPPPTPRDDKDAAALAAAILASKKQWHKDEKVRQKRQRKAVSTSPLRQKKTNKIKDNLPKYSDLSNNNDNRQLHSLKNTPSIKLNSNGLIVVPSAPPLPPFNKLQQQYFLKQSDFT